MEVPPGMPLNFGHYAVLNAVQTGSTCVVVRARDNKSKEIVAAKIVSRALLRERGIVLSFEEELRLHARLECRYIVKLLDVVYLPDYIVVVLESLETDLYSLLVSGALHLRMNIQETFSQIVSAVAYLHEHNIVHRDLKPENILVDEFGHVKLSDLGCSADLSLFDTRRKGPCGTIYYVAPECFRGRAVNLKACDIWALGVILYALAVGVLPWKNVYDDEDVKKQILSGDFEMPQGLHPRIRRVIESCMKMDPNERPTARELLEDGWSASRKLIPKDNSVARPIVVARSFNRKNQINLARIERGAFIMRQVRSSILRR